ncbi:DUF1016 N-terminal domain-containing protein [Kribbella sp. NPDC026596]|uniref:DUF1016 N-terminal domain-containing protein n=1 Tax=Kribbella sp. NPDC026596 TaxID=3155122 RepID=UPI0033D514F2
MQQNLRRRPQQLPTNHPAIFAALPPIWLSLPRDALQRPSCRPRGVRKPDGMNDKTPRFESAPARTSLPAWYPDLLDSVSEDVATGHRRAVTAANQEMLMSYWSIGHKILDRQHEEGWGSKVIDRLSTDLKARFPGATGYSPRNLKYMRAFAAAWPDPAFVQRGIAQLPWRHHVALLEKLHDPEHRLWYAAAAVERGWSRDILALHIEGRFHERAGKAVTNFATAMPP